jgi:hypothetical protein
MNDDAEIPELNGTIKKLTDMLAQPIDTPEIQEKVTKELIKLELNMWLLQRETNLALVALLKERKSILDMLFDRAIGPVVTVVIIVILYLVFQSYSP